MSKTVVLTAGESHQEGDFTITVQKCGLLRQGAGDPVPTVTLEFENGKQKSSPQGSKAQKDKA